MHHERLLKIDSNHLRCLFYKDAYIREIFEGVFAKDQFIKERLLEKETYMCVVNEQGSQFPRSNWVMVFQEKNRIS